MQIRNANAGNGTPLAGDYTRAVEVAGATGQPGDGPPPHSHALGHEVFMAVSGDRTALRSTLGNHSRRTAAAFLFRSTPGVIFE